MNHAHAATEPTRAEIGALAGPTVIEFGSPWCGYCRAAQPLLAQAFADHPRVRHIKIADADANAIRQALARIDPAVQANSAARR